MTQTTILEQILVNPLVFWLLIAFVIITIIQVVYFWMFFSRLFFNKEKTRNEEHLPVSVVITANNQYTDLKSNLQSWLSQDYPNFEVVVVIDNSDDGSKELLKDFSRHNDNLHIVELMQKLNWFSGRKFPLSLGIKSASNDLILLTDHTCKPETSTWIREMVSAYTPGKEIVMGYTTFATKTGINKWLRFTAFYDALFYLSMALSGLPFKGIGKNLSYSRNLFYNHKGFSSHYVINAGDDELFVNRASNKSNVAIKITPESRVLHVRKISLSKWFATERTRLKIRRFFKWRDRLLIRGFSFTSFAFYGLLVFLLIMKVPLLILLSLFALRFISQMVIFGLVQKKLSEKNLLLLSPVFEILLILIDFVIWASLLFSRKSKWI